MQTTMKKNNLNPAWKESFDIDWHGEEIIQIECWDHNKVSCYSFDVIQSTVRLKYDETHPDQKFPASELYPLIARKRPRGTTSWSLEAPTKRPRTEGVYFTFREFLVRMGVIVFDKYCGRYHGF